MDSNNNIQRESESAILTKFQWQLLLIAAFTLPVGIVLWMILLISPPLKIDFPITYSVLVNLCLLAFALGNIQARWWSFPIGVRNGMQAGLTFLLTEWWFWGIQHPHIDIVACIGWVCYLSVGAILGEESRVAKDAALQAQQTRQSSQPQQVPSPAPAKPS